MPLPLILGLAAAATVATGAKKAYDGYQDKSEADLIIEQAKQDYNAALNALESANKSTYEKLEQLGELHLKIGQDFNEFQTIAESLLDKLKGAGGGSLKLDIPQYKLNQIKTISINSVAYLGKLVGGAAGGAAAAYAVYGGVMALAAASTGTPIAALSGVAAYNATLAAIGGGSLAAGGLGMAGGAMILGGVVAAPVIAVAGWAYASHAADALEKAKEARDDVEHFQWKSEKSCKDLRKTRVYVNDVIEGTEEIYAFFREYLDDLKLIEMILRRGQTDILDKEVSLLEVVKNGYAVAAILTDVITTPLFKTKMKDGKPEVDEKGIPQFETDSNGVKKLNDAHVYVAIDLAKEKLESFKK